MQQVWSPTKLLRISDHCNIRHVSRSTNYFRTPAHRLVISSILRQAVLLSNSNIRTTALKAVSRYRQGIQARRVSTLLNKVSPADNDVLDEGLTQNEYNRKRFVDAINGKKVPFAHGSPLMEACLIRGIRHHDGFGTGLYGTPKFDRARNARAIMSNRVPEIQRKDHFPYCIWHPEVATEDTYRRVAQRYPEMLYQVGRACAVAGYVDLYRELKLLPEVSIAEEARDNAKNGCSIQIFNEIMAAPTRFAVMNDYTRTINTENPQPGMFLNADTAVRSSLDRKLGCSYADSSDISPLVPDTYWNITEDWNFDIASTKEANNSVPDLRIPLLYSSLPRDLPNINKDLLIYQAAYTGNIERYVRLRRPTQNWPREEPCIIRGIHYNTTFAKWWSMVPEIMSQEFKFSHPHEAIIRAINARYIMNNNLTRIKEETPEAHLPYLIYLPDVADEETYAELFRRKPCMKLAIARACIVADYQSLYESMDVESCEYLRSEAREATNQFYFKDQEKKGYMSDGYEIGNTSR